MAGCEWCWSAASQRAAMMGGSVAEHYEKIRREQNEMGDKAICPIARGDDAPAGGSGA